MNWINRKIAFMINRSNCFVYGINSHGILDPMPTLIFKNGDEFRFKGYGEGDRFRYKKGSIVAITNNIKNIQLTDEEIEKELINALKRFGFFDVICE
jgi:hypothetical protein